MTVVIYDRSRNAREHRKRPVRLPSEVRQRIDTDDAVAERLVASVINRGVRQSSRPGDELLVLRCYDVLADKAAKSGTVRKSHPDYSGGDVVPVVRRVTKRLCQDGILEQTLDREGDLVLRLTREPLIVIGERWWRGRDMSWKGSVLNAWLTQVANDLLTIDPDRVEELVEGYYKRKKAKYAREERAFVLDSAF